jgi:RNA polymerase sigma-70 factor (ECF subfamily)
MGNRTSHTADTEPSNLAGGLADDVITQAQSGDGNAIRYLYTTLQPRMLAYLRATVGETDAEDVASETWTRISRDLRNFNGNRRDFNAWALTIARYRAIDHLRRRPLALFLPPEELPQHPAHNNTERDAIDALATARTLDHLAELPPDQARAILLRVIAGLDTTTVATLLGKRTGAIRMAAHRGLRNLAKRFQLPTDDQPKR